jgi:hypothetical protein
LFVLLRMHSKVAAANKSPWTGPQARLRRWVAATLAVGTGVAMVIFVGIVGTSAASASQSSVGLGTATPFAVLAGTTVTNTGPSVISGDLGVSPGSAITGFPPGKVINGTQHKADAVALQAESDLTTGYKDAAGRTPATTVSADLGGKTLAPGVYKATSTLGLTGTVTLDAQNDPNGVFIFQVGSKLTTASSSTVKLTGGAEACNVFWQVGSSATLGTNTTFVGSVLALTSATVQTGTTVAGRVLARNGQVSLDANTITMPTCKTTTSATTTTTSATTTTTTPTTATTTTGVIPGGAPHTGAGGASRSGDNAVLVALGALALVGAGAAMSLAIRRRRAIDGLGGRDV